jgi:hypothetical protein
MAIRVAASWRSCDSAVGSDQVGRRSMKFSTTVLGVALADWPPITHVNVTEKRSVVPAGSISEVHLTWRSPSSNSPPVCAAVRSDWVRSCERANETSVSFAFA